MENKKYIIYLIITLCICFVFVGYFNYDKILDYINNKEWEFAESFSTVKLENIYQVEAGKNLLVLTNNKLNLYNADAKLEYTKDMKVSKIITNSCEEYIVMVVNDTNQIYLYKGSELVWNNKLNYTVLNASVNKNGYVTIIYSQSGSKSSIKIFKPSGEELFTTILGSTYAVDVEISNDNKYLYIAEIDTEGIKIKSNIKIIEIMANTNVNNEPNMNTLLVGNDTLITDIEYSDKNTLVILRDSGIDIINNNKELKNIVNFEPKNTIFSRIEDLKYPIIIEKVSTGIFTNETNLKVFKDLETLDVKLEKTPQSIDTENGKIALNLGDEVLILNENGNIEKRYELENQLLDVKLYNKGNTVALVFRDRIEFVKI